MAKISKLTPVLYKENETDFNHNGLGRLKELVTYRIEEVLNGEFEAFFEYPANGSLADKIDNKMLIKAKPNRKDEPTLFRIYEYELDIATGNYLIYARHKNIDDLGSNLVLDLTVRDATLNQAWNMAKNNAIEPVDISFHSDLLTTSSTTWTRRSLLNCIAGEQGSMIQNWGGEIKHGNNWLWVYRRRGQDNATTVRHGKNLSGLTATYSTKGLTTAIVPYHSYQVEKSDEDKVIYGDVVQSQYVNNYPHVYYDAIEYTDEDLGLDSEATEAERLNRLNVVAERWFVENTGKDLPSINMVINLEDISQTKEYSKFKYFEQIDLGDTIDVYSEMYKVHVSARVRRVVYNGLTDQNEEVEVGTVSRTIYDDYRELVDERVQEVNKQIQTVQIAANGKNRVFRGPIEPSVGMAKNDIWYKPVGEGEIELYTFDGAHWTLEKVSAGLLSGTLDAENGDVNLINVNVANIVGETSNFVRSAWNSSLGGGVFIDGNAIRSNANDGSQVYIQNGIMGARNPSGASLGYIGYKKDTDGSPMFNIQTSWGSHFTVHSNLGDGQEKKMLQITAGSDETLFYTQYVRLLGERLSIGWNHYLSGSTGRLLITGDESISLRANESTVFAVSNNGTKNFATLYADLDMGGSTILNQSDARLKENIEKAKVNGIEETKRLRMVEYDWKKDHPRTEGYSTERQFGLLAQDTPFLAVQDSEDHHYLSIDLRKQVNLNTLTNQELIERVEKLEELVKEAM